MATKREAEDLDYRPSRKSHYEPDPLNVSIYLYRHKGLTWEKVAKAVNSEYNLGRTLEAPTLSWKACSHRFEAHADRIAIWRGDGNQASRKPPGLAHPANKPFFFFNHDRIYTLRTQHDASWVQIANDINDQFGLDDSCNEKRQMTNRLCLKRFTGTAERIATKKGHTFEMAWYVGESRGRHRSLSSTSGISRGASLKTSSSAVDGNGDSGRSTRLNRSTSCANTVDDDEEVKESYASSPQKLPRRSEDSDEAANWRDQNMAKVVHGGREGTSSESRDTTTIKDELHEDAPPEKIAPSHRDECSSHVEGPRELSVNDQIIMRAVTKVEPKFWEEVGQLVNALAEEGEELSVEEIEAAYNRIREWRVCKAQGRARES